MGTCGRLVHPAAECAHSCTGVSYRSMSGESMFLECKYSYQCHGDVVCLNLSVCLSVLKGWWGRKAMQVHLCVSTTSGSAWGWLSQGIWTVQIPPMMLSDSESTFISECACGCWGIYRGGGTQGRYTVWSSRCDEGVHRYKKESTRDKELLTCGLCDIMEAVQVFVRASIWQVWELMETFFVLVWFVVVFLNGIDDRRRKQEGTVWCVILSMVASGRHRIVECLGSERTLKVI